MRRASAVVNEDGPRDDGRRRHTVVTLDDGLYPVGGQDLECGALRWCGEGVRVFPQVQRAIGALAAAVVADGLGNGQDVGLVKRSVQRRAAVPAGTEADPLSRVIHIGLARVILLFESGQVHQDVLWG